MDPNFVFDEVLNFCPTCGERLEIHSASLEKACFLHGDFVVLNPKPGIVKVEWRIMEHT